LFRFLLSVSLAFTMSLFASVAQAQYAEIYGGTSLGGQDLNYGPVPPAAPNLQQMDSGPVLGAGYYVGIPTTPFQIGGDIMMTNQDYSTWGPGSNLGTVSLMANGRYHQQLGSGLTGYLGAGLGAIHVSYDDPLAILDGSDTIGGYQLEAGIVYALSAQEIFMSVKYQAGFNEAYIQSESVEYNSTSFLVGLRF